MSYTPINWQTGDTITAEKMNKMDNGWSVDASERVLFNETITTEQDPNYPDEPAFGTAVYSEQITADTITVTFNGVDYVCTKQVFDSNTYGGYDDNDGFDFSTYPFVIFSDVGENSIATATGGTFTIKVAASQESIELSDAFKTAANSAVDTSAMPMLCVSGVTTIQEMGAATFSGRLLYFQPFGGTVNTTCIITSYTSNTVDFIPTVAGVSVTFVDGVFFVGV